MMSANKIKQDAPMSVLFTMLFAGQIASTIFLPGLPSIAAELNIPRSIVQTMVPVYLAAFASTQLIIGPLSDKFGRKPIVLLGILLFTIASISLKYVLILISLSLDILYCFGWV